jgi:uncharacterized protein YhbP (UPF0306 family)
MTTTELRERELVEEFVALGKLLQLATLTEAGNPVVCNVWYAARHRPDKLWFISRPSRHHSENIRQRPPVAGSIMPFSVEGLGQVARAVTFTGTARELATTGIDAELAVFLARWPQAQPTIDSPTLASGSSPSRLYEITVEEWVLFDEHSFPDQPRRVVAPG